MDLSNVSLISMEWIINDVSKKHIYIRTVLLYCNTDSTHKNKRQRKQV